MQIKRIKLFIKLNEVASTVVPQQEGYGFGFRVRILGSVPGLGGPVWSLHVLSVAEWVPSGFPGSSHRLIDL